MADDNSETPGEKIARLGSRLTLEQRTFCEAFIETQDAKQAMQTAYAKETGAYALLRRWYIGDYITAVCEGSTLQDLLVTREEVLATLAHQMRNAAEPRDKIRSAEVVGKFLGMATTRLEVTGKDGGPVAVDVGLDATQIAKLRSEFLGVDPETITEGD